MNKSKFLKRSLATLLAILMVVAMVPSALAAGEDTPEIFVDNRRATRDGNDYSITIYDTDDVLISWTPIPDTKMSVVTKDKIEKDLDARIYLPENAAFDGTDTYTLTLKEKVGKNDPIDHVLKITIKSTKPTNECRLGGIRVDKTSGRYKLGYLGDGTNDVLGYSKKVESTGFEAHAIEGVVSGSTVTVTLPFGMTPENVGFDAAGIPNSSKATAVFAPMSVVAKSSYTYNSTTKTGEVKVTAQSGATKTYTVKFVSEKVFDSFQDATNLKDLENVTKIQSYAGAVGVNDQNGAKYTLNVKKEVSNPATNTATTWTPVYKATDRLQRLMGAGYVAEDIVVAKPKLGVGTTTKTYERMSNAVSIDGNLTGAMLRLVTSGHATWDLGGTAFTASDSDYVYLLVRTKANPSGAFVEVKLNPVQAPAAAPRITEIQAANTMSDESAAFVAADATSISVVLDKEYSNDAGGSETAGDKTDISKVYLHVTTDLPAYVRIPSQEENTPAVWSSSYDTDTPDTHHLLKNVNAKDGSVTIQITDANGKNPRNYTINFRVATTNKTELERVALYTAGGTKIAESIKQADKTAPRELEVPYEFFPTAGDIDQHPTNTVAGSPLAGLYLFIVPSDGAAVAPGATETQVNVDNVTTDSGVKHTCSGDDDITGNKTHIFENGRTTVGDVWNADFTAADFDDALTVTVSNAGDGTAVENYQIKLKRKLPKTEAELDSVETNKALDDDYVYSQAHTLGKEETGQTDIGQAYAPATAEDFEGNKLPAEIVGNDIIVTVPADWDAATDALYLTTLLKTTDTKELYRYVDDAIPATATAPKAARLSVLNPYEQKDQTENDVGSRMYTGDVNRFINLTEVGGGVEEQNVIYAVSEKDYWQNLSTSAGGDTLGALKTYSTAYEVHIKYAPDNSEERELKGVTTANPELATVSFNAEYGMITVSVPNSTDWPDGYRGDRSKNFKLNFTASEGALIIDKGQKMENDITAGNGSVNGAANANGRYTAATPAQQAEYKRQLNERDQITNDTEFFVLNGELYIYDPLTGDEIPVTGVGGKFTNNNWAAIKSKQAEIQVYDENQNDMITYRLDLKVGPSQPTSSDATLSSVKANNYSATLSGTAYTVIVPEGTDLTKVALSLTATDSKAQGITVNTKAYTEGMEVDLTKPATIVVTAESGVTATYTLTAEIGTPPTPWTNPFKDVKESDWFYDAVKYVSQNDLMVGDASGRFNPRSNLTRAEFAQILYKNEGNPDATWTNKFSDVKESDWYAKQIIWASEEEILAGYPDGKAHPRDSITREQLASLLWRYKGSPAPTGTALNFSDAASVNSYAKDAMIWAVENGIMQGNNNKLNPKGNATRAEAAQMLMQFFKNN